jgi:hypothetical protein
VRALLLFAAAAAAAACGILGCKSSPGVPLTHRASDLACPLGTPVASALCDSSSDCPATLRATCLAYDDAGLARFCNADACHLDSDCADGGVCLCGAAASGGALATPNVCLAPGNCRLDSDCAPVRFCSPSSVGCGIAFAYYCHTPGDDCGSDDDCRKDQLCQYAPGPAKWTCFSVGTCGG